MRPDFQLCGDDLTYLTRICRLVGGMPLALVLAAGWVDTVTPAEVVAEIARSLDFLETELSDVPERQRSIRAVFDHSWRLLAEREREVMQRLSVFRRGFTREAAQAIAGTSLRDLKSMVNKSLLQLTPLGRYEIHELVRQFAAEKLETSPGAGHLAAAETRNRHCGFFAAALEQWRTDLKGPRQITAIAEMQADQDNVRGAWDWAVDKAQVARLDQALEGLCRFYYWRGRFHEAESVCAIAAANLAATACGDGPLLHVPSAAEGSPSERPVRGTACPELRRRGEGLRVLARILTWQGCFSELLGRMPDAMPVLQQSLALFKEAASSGADTRAERAEALYRLAHVTRFSDIEESARLVEQSLALYEELDDQW